jgi:hypothetical protein
VKGVAKGGNKTVGQFCAALRATPNLMAKGGIEPPTHGFSAAPVICSHFINQTLATHVKLQEQQ